MVKKGIAKIHVVESVRRGFLHDGARFAVIDPRSGDIDITVSHVHPPRKERWMFRPVEKIRAVGYAKLGRDVVEAGVRQVESAVDSNDARIFCPSNVLPWLRGVEDRASKSCEIEAIC